jgi:hypothetical protein
MVLHPPVETAPFFGNYGGCHLSDLQLFVNLNCFRMSTIWTIALAQAFGASFADDQGKPAGVLTLAKAAAFLLKKSLTRYHDPILESRFHAYSAQVFSFPGKMITRLA